ncbi:MAG: hypothetical protein COB30_012860 [Ectothiorhodospiraceae bacterium]|nr:hypothetical protein [Ectothiorhodospiraceae bacterium]
MKILLTTFTFIFTFIIVITGCTNKNIKPVTLGDIDRNTKTESTTGAYLIPKTEDEIRKAYSQYLSHASKNDRSRADALSRLASLEFKLSEQILRDKNDNNEGAADDADDQLYYAQLDRTIELLSTALRDYPNEKNNDKTLYQLAKAYDQKGDEVNTLKTIELIANKYPKSKYYIESQFRLAEKAFSTRQYSLSEDKYTEVIGSKKNNIFYEKSLYKRAWSRFKQEFYFEAVDDLIRVIKFNDFDYYEKLSNSKKDLFNEYFRAIGLSFSYMGGVRALEDYFKREDEFKHLYYVYAHVSDIYLKGERKSDAVDTLTYFASNNPSSNHVPEAMIKIIDIWQSAGFSNKMNIALDVYYAKYNPGKQYWNNRKANDSRIFKTVNKSLRTHILTVSANHHKKYQKNHKLTDYQNAKRWYENYLTHYSSYSQKDNIHYLYASLLAEAGNNKEAIKHYILAGYDSNIIIDKKSAYQSILLASALVSNLVPDLTSTLASKTTQEATNLWTKKLIHFSTLFSQQYPNDKRTIKIIAHASELAYNSQLYSQTITLAESISKNISNSLAIKINTLKANAYFKQKHYPDAENTYRAILNDYDLIQRDKTSTIDGLALSIYYQGKESFENNDKYKAIQHYSRISAVAPHSTIASTGLYDAIALTMESKLWKESIKLIKEFQRLYPRHKYFNDVSKKLTTVYLNSKQHIAAAKELEKLAYNEQDSDYQLAALWKAGELYEDNKDYNSAIRSFTRYAKIFRSPFPQYMESMFKLVSLYTLKKDAANISYWQGTIVSEDKKTPNSLRSDRTRYIASSAALFLARDSHLNFTKAKLVLPLKKNLRIKKRAMQKTVNLYGQASSYNVAETATEATHAIAELYNEFSRALLQSERPKHLDADDLEQYQILLEDQAFPFEEKAIEFYEINLRHVKDGIFDKWIKESHTRLQTLFPVRYKRSPLLDGVINVLH